MCTSLATSVETRQSHTKMLRSAVLCAVVASAQAFVGPVSFGAAPQLRSATSGVSMMAESDVSRRNIVQGGAVLGGAIIAAPMGAEAKEAKGFLDPSTYGKKDFRAPVISLFDEREGCSRKSKEYTGRIAGNQNDDMCVVVKYRAIAADIDAAKAIFASFGRDK